MIGREDFAFANDVRAALEQRAPRLAWILVAAIGVLVFSGLAWASWATLDEVTTGSGKVIPSSQTQIVQTLERAIVREIKVKEGDLIERDQVLLRIDDTDAASQLGEQRQKQYSLLAEIARLETEAKSADEVAFAAELRRDAPLAVNAERQAFRARRAKLELDRAILHQQALQREQELLEFQAKLAKLQASLGPLAKELAITRDMHRRGVVPEVELLRMERQEAEMKGELAVVRAAIPRAEAAIREVETRVAMSTAEFQAQVHERLARASAELAVLEESIKAASDRVRRTALKAPLAGIINKLNVTTVGAVVQPGQDLVEIVPIDETLLIEAQVRPQDVAFISPGQEASVKLTAYDYRIYGMLPGRVDRVSADTLANERGETYYRVIVRTDHTHVDKNGEQLPILPGMVATVDILTGKKTVLEYLLKPIDTMRHEALRER